nr:odorant receptor 59b-like [Onthophagus taurus]
MRKVYSPLYLAQFFSTLISTCMDFFIISTNAESLDIAEVINKFFYVATIQIQFALYCFPAEYLTEQLKNLSDAVYASKWYESKPSFRRELTMIMAASLKQSAFTAGGFSDVRMSTFTNVLKLSFSFFTCEMMTNMQEQEESGQFQNFCRMASEDFDHLLSLITKKIPAYARLAVILRFLQLKTPLKA